MQLLAKTSGNMMGISSARHPWLLGQCSERPVSVWLFRTLLCVMASFLIWLATLSTRQSTQRGIALRDHQQLAGNPKILGHIDLEDVAGGYHAYQFNAQSLVADRSYANDTGKSCFDIAAQAAQAYTDNYRRRFKPPTSLPGGIPRAFFRWEGNITREEFDSVQFRLPRNEECPHCGPTVRYQIIKGHLYRLGTVPVWMGMFAEDVILTAIHLWDLPDMDFIIHLDDSCPPYGVPVMSWNVCRHKTKAGFTLPSYSAWKFALGEDQLKVHYQCLEDRYPLQTRRPAVIWRGSTTDPKRPSFNIPIVDKVARMQIHKKFTDDPLVDAKVTKVLFSDECIKSYLGPLAAPMEIEDYNKAAIIMDVDGNGWSDRFVRIAHYNTPLLKQASNHTAFFEHLMAPGHAMEYFKNDLSDVKGRAHQLLKEWRDGAQRLVQQAQQRQALALHYLNNVAIAEAMAYSLLAYSQKLTWKTERNTTYTHVPFSQACHQGNPIAHLPEEFCKEINSRPAVP